MAGRQAKAGGGVARTAQAAAGGSRRARSARWRAGRGGAKARGGRLLAPSAGAVAIVLFVFAACGVLAWAVGDDEYHATAIGWAPLVASVSAVAGAFAYLQFARRGLRFSQQGQLDSCTRGEQASFVTRFRNAGPLVLFGVEAHFAVLDERGDALTRSVITLSLAPREVYDLDFRVTLEHLGVYRIGLEYVVVTDYLRLLRARIDGAGQDYVAVEPRCVTLAGIDLSNVVEQEVVRPQRSVLSDSIDYAGLRDYRLGDPLKAIHWKVSARTGTLVTRLFETSVNPSIAVVMSFATQVGDPAGQRFLFDAVVEAALSVARSAQGAGVEVELCYCSKQHEQVRRGLLAAADVQGLVDELPMLGTSEELRCEADEALRRVASSREAPGTVVVCGADASAEAIDAIARVRGYAKDVLACIAFPSSLEGHERERYLAPLTRLEAADIAYVAFARVEELAGVRL